tara:strand:+ start:3523 stop:4827 length:1305 start_codon:yes stop_codon:yes gene_type:complete
MKPLKIKKNTELNFLKTEQYILSALLQNIVDESKRYELMTPKLFIYEKHITIVEAIRYVHDQKLLHDITLPEIVKALHSSNKLSFIGGESYLKSLESNEVQLTNLTKHVDKLFRYADLRKLNLTLLSYIDRSPSANYLSPDLLQKKAASLIRKITEDQHTDKHLTGTYSSNTLLKIALEKLDKINDCNLPNKINTYYFNRLHSLVNHFRCGDVVEITSDSSDLNNQLALNLVNSFCFENKQAVLMLSRPKSGISLTYQLMALNSGIHYSKLLNTKLGDSDWPKLTAAITKMKDKNLFICDDGELDADTVRYSISKVNMDKNNPIRFLVIGNFSSFNNGLENRLCEQNSLISNFKQIAIDYECTVIFLSTSVIRESERQTLKNVFVNYTINMSIQPENDLADEQALDVSILSQNDDYLGEISMYWNKASQVIYES